MSSLVRTIQKKIAKGMGYHRGPSRTNANGDTILGLILDSNGNSTGSTRWPQVKAPTKGK